MRTVPMLHFYCPLEIKKSGQTHLKLQIEFDWRDRTRPLVIKTYFLCTCSPASKFMHDD